MPGPAYASGKRGKTIHLRSVIHTFKGSSNPDSTKCKSLEDERSPIEINDSFLAQLYKKLGDKTCGYHERAQTAVEVRQRLDEFQADFISSLWSSANDLVALEVPQSTRRVALELLLECVNRCEDESLRYNYLRTTLDLLKSSLEEGELSIDPNMDLLLACLKECLCGTTLSDEESTLSACVIEEVISEALRDPKKMPTVSIPILIDIVMHAKTLVRESSMLELMNFLSFFLAVPDANNAELHLCILDYMLYLVRQHETLLSPKVIHQLVVFSERMSQSNDARHVAKLSCMLRALAGSAPKKEFLNQLLQLTTEKKGSWDFVLERYATYFVESSNGNGGSKDEIEILLNKLYCMKKDKITLKIIEQLCENSSGNQTLESEEISADSLIWALIRSILTRLGDSCTKTQFTNTLLNLLANNDSITPPSVDKLIQLICELQLQVDFSGLIGLASSRRQELRDIATLTMITDRVLVPDAPQHCQLFELLTSLMQETEFGPLSNEKHVFALITNIFMRIRTIELSEIACSFCAELTYLCLQRLSTKHFSSLIHDQILLDIKAILAKKKRRKSIVNTIGTFGRSKQPIDQKLFKVDALVECLVKGFIWSATEVTGYKTPILFDTLYSVYNVAEKCAHENTLLTIARAMVRIRCDSTGFFYFTNPKDAVGISSALGRFKDDLQNKDLKWFFPEKLAYIDESLLYVRNKNVLFAAGDKPRCIDMAKWLSLAVNTIKAPMAWDIYSYLLTHLCSQLAEVALFQDHPGLINDLKTVICQHLTSKLPSTVELEGSASRCNLQAAFVRNLSSVLAYHPYEPKEFADEIVSAIVIGVASWEKTLIPVLHILCVSCYEVPLSVQKNLSPMLLQIQKRMTNCYAIPSILEFFIALKNSPTVIMNLTVEEIKRVFAIVFKLIEYSVDLTLRSKVSANEAPKPKTSQPQNQEYEVEISSSTETFFVGEAMAEFFEYQSFMVLTFWYLCLNSTRKKELFPFVMGGLQKLQDVEGLKYDVLAHVDFITRSQFISQGDWNIDESESEVIEGHTDSARWIHNTTLISIKSRRKRAVITVWKPTCTLSFAFEPLAKVEQQEYKLFDFEKPKDSATATDDLELSDCTRPKVLLTQLCYLLGIPEVEQDRMLRVPDDPILNRSISTLDRVPNKELQKTGIIYIGPNQNTEEQILNNTKGTYQYNWFLSQMGYFIKLSERRKLFYIGGLEDVIDGEYALVWSDEATQIAFHTVTLFPETSDLSSKKKHVGNNFVNIFYDESGLPDFNFNIIKSQFTFISIVITPHTTHDSPKISDRYTVKLYRRTGTPGLFSCAHFKILTKHHLARYVRHISQIANALAQKIHEQHSLYACSAWGIRCKHLNTIRERVARSQGINSKH